MDNQKNADEINDRDINKPVQLHYDAFISYRHSETDMYVAKTLHKKLESFRMPKSVLKKYPGIRKKLSRVFRDQEELPLSDNLSDPIDAALVNSDFLIVICTPRLPESKWCQKEIETFISLHGRERVLVVLAEGEPYESFPEILTYEDVEVKNDDGTVSVVRRELEPLGAEARGRTHKEINKNLDDAVIKICAAIFGLNYDDLRQRHREQRIRKIAAACATAAAVLLAFLCVCVFFLVKIKSQNEIISQQYSQIKYEYAISQAEKSRQLLADGKRYESIKTAREVLPDEYSDEVTATALYALNTGFGTYYNGGKLMPEVAYLVGPRLYDLVISDDESVIAGYDTSGMIYLFNEKGCVVDTIDNSTDDYFSMSIMLLDNDNLIIYSDGTVSRYCIPEKERYEIDLPEAEEGASLLYCGENRYMVYISGVLYCVDEGDNILYSADLAEKYDYDASGSYIADCSYREESDKIVIGISMTDYDLCSLVTVFDVKTGNIEGELLNESAIINSVVIDDDTIYTAEVFEGSSAYSVVSLIAAYDIKSGKYIWSRKFADYQFSSISLFDYNGEECLLVNGNYALLTMYADDGTSIAQTLSEYTIMDAYYQEEAGSVYYICSEGVVRSINLYYGFISDETDILFEYAPDDNIIMAKKLNDSFYVLMESANYAVKYSYINVNPSQCVYEDFRYELSSDCKYATDYDENNNLCIYDIEKQEYIWNSEFSPKWADFMSCYDSAIYMEGSDFVLYDYLKDEEILCISMESEGLDFYKMFDNDRVAVFTDDKRIYVYEMEQEKLIGEFKQSRMDIDKTVFLKDAYIGIADGRLVKSDYEGNVINSTEADLSHLEYMTLCSDGRYFGVLWTDGSVTVYDTDSVKEINNIRLDTDLFEEFNYFADGNIYVVSDYTSSYILDRDFNIVAKANLIYGLRDSHLYTAGPIGLCTMDYLEYNEIIEKVDQYLSDN